MAKAVYDAKTVAELLAAIKEKNNWSSNHEAATGMGIGSTTVNKLVKNEMPHDWKIIDALKAASGLELPQLLEIVGWIKPDNTTSPGLRAVLYILKEFEKEDPQEAKRLIKSIYSLATSFIDKADD